MNRVTIQEAKMLDQVDYLAFLGFYPEKMRGQEYWYRSPLREEHTPSFKVDKAKGVWYDHGIGQGGTIIDFGIAYFRCDVREFLERLKPYLSFHRPQLPVQVPAPSAVQSSNSQAGEKKGIVVLSAGPLASPQLSRYLAERKISLSIAAAYCQEVHFELSGRRFPVKQVKKEVRAVVRYSRVEYFVIKEKAAQVGISISNYIREITINGKVMARLPEEEGQAVSWYVGQYQQLTKACHQQGLLQAILYFEHFRDQLDVILKKLTP